MYRPLLTDRLQAHGGGGGFSHPLADAVSLHRHLVSRLAPSAPRAGFTPRKQAAVGRLRGVLEADHAGVFAEGPGLAQ